ncbi:arsenate reductase ArsC [Desulfobulbus alkaliphilus]|uniref:arsenate reductase ArsC n=1 Tax=Desulfobulbus alkaliphilus TaxID=869814 RepID=UPI001964D295|nr:arsenate reductase ArsC [Desulfobulbus alkaliphilus]MBM9536094.1 arsenate reductase ArsC [Desulfobulbus alkaliphilus]
MMNVLFVCEHNSARSQMAEAFLNRLGGDSFLAESCGLEAGTLNPLVVEVMMEIGYDLRSKTTQSALDLFRQGQSYDMIITVCSPQASEGCPLFPGRALRFNWPFDDPSRVVGDRESQLAAIRTIRDQIKEKIEELIAQYRDKGLKMFL